MRVRTQERRSRLSCLLGKAECVEPFGYDRRVVRPNGPIVIAVRIEVERVIGKRAKAGSPHEEITAHKPARDRSYMLFSKHRVRSAALVAVDRPQCMPHARAGH